MSDGTYQNVVMHNMTLEGEIAIERVRNLRLRKALAAVLEVGFVANTEDGLFCNYCQISTEYPDESDDYAHAVLNHRADCVYVIAKGVLEEMEREAEADGE